MKNEISNDYRNIGHARAIGHAKINISVPIQALFFSDSGMTKSFLLPELEENKYN